MAVGAVCYHFPPLEVRGFLLFSEKNRGNFLIFNFKREFPEQGYKSTKRMPVKSYPIENQTDKFCMPLKCLVQNMLFLLYKHSELNKTSCTNRKKKPESSQTPALRYYVKTKQKVLSIVQHHRHKQGNQFLVASLCIEHHTCTAGILELKDNRRGGVGV